MVKRSIKLEWILVLCGDKQHSTIATVMHVPTIKEVSVILNVPSSTISNTYYRLIRPAGVLEHVSIVKHAEDQFSKSLPARAKDARC